MGWGAQGHRVVIVWEARVQRVKVYTSLVLTQTLYIALFSIFNF